MARTSLTAVRVTRPRRPRLRTLFACCAALLLAVLSGCTHVAPYERESLAKPGMDTRDRELLRRKFQAHVFEAREGAMPGGTHAGGGCGCN